MNHVESQHLLPEILPEYATVSHELQEQYSLTLDENQSLREEVDELKLEVQRLTKLGLNVLRNWRRRTLICGRCDSRTRRHFPRCRNGWSRWKGLCREQIHSSNSSGG